MELVLNRYKREIIVSLSVFLVCSAVMLPVSAEDVSEIEIRIVDKDQLIYLEPGSDYQIQASVWKDGVETDEKPTFLIDSYSYYDTEEAFTLSEDGKVTALGIGDLTVQVTYENCIDEIGFTSRPEFPEEINYFASTIGVVKGSVIDPEVSFSPYYARNTNHTFTIEDPAIAEVTENNEIRGLSAGSTRLTVSFGNGLSASTDLLVLDGNYAKEINILENNLEIHMKQGETHAIQYELIPYTDSEGNEIPMTDEVVTWDFAYQYEADRYGNVISISPDGVITALETADARIDLKARLQNGYEAYFSVSVAEEVQKIEFIDDPLFLMPEETIWLAMTTEPENADTSTFTYTSSDESVVKYADGFLTGIAPGNATITVTAENGVSASFEVVVREGKYATEITCQSSMSLKVGEAKKVEYTLTPSDATDEIVTFTVPANLKNIISVDNDGTVTGLETGAARLTARITNGNSDTIIVHVYSEPRLIAFSDETITLPVGQTIRSSLQLKPADARGVAINYSIADPSIAEIKGDEYNTEAYSLMTLKPGTTVITATTETGLTTSAKLVVVDGSYANRISINEDNIRMKVGEKKQFTYTLQPVNSKDEVVKWSIYSFNGDTVAEVDQNGVVTAVGYGTTVVQAELQNGNKAQTTVCVSKKPENITFSKETIYVPLAGSKSLMDILSVDGVMLDDLSSSSMEQIPDLSIEDTSIAQSSRYEIYGLKTGRTTVTASLEGVTATADIVVYEPEEPVSITKADGPTVIYTDTEATFRVNYAPETADNKTVWSVEDESIATIRYPVSKITEGRMDYIILHANKAGKTKLTATSTVNPELSVTYDIEVKDGYIPSDDVQMTYRHYEQLPNDSVNKAGNGDVLVTYVGKTYQSTIVYTFVTGNYPSQFYDDIRKLIKDQASKQDVFEIDFSSMGVGLNSKTNVLSMAYTITPLKSGEMELEIYPNGPKIRYIAVGMDITDPEVSADTSVSAALITELEQAEVVSADQLVEQVDAIAVAENAGIDQERVEELDADGQKVVVQLSFDIKAESMVKTDEEASVTLDITPKYKAVILDKNAPDMSTDGTVLASGELEINDTVTMSVPVGDLFDGMNIEEVYINHEKESGETYQYTGTLNDNIVEFENPHGFSKFTITSKDTSVARIGGVGYATVEDAIKELLNNQTLVITKNLEKETDITISKAISFTLENHSDKNVTIKAGKGYIVTESEEFENYYIVTKDPDSKGGNITATVTSYADNTNTPVVLLYPSDKADTEIMSDYRTGNKTGVLYEGSVADTTAGTKRTETQITVEEVEDGDYKMLVYMEGKYIPVIREVTVSGEDVDLGTIDLYLYGDVNFDGAVNTRDSQQILRYYAGKTSVFDQGSEEEKELRKTAANVTNPKQGDSDINTRDSQQILRYYAGKTSVLDEIK